MKKALSVVMLAAFVAALALTFACSKGGGEPLVGNWEMVGNPQKIVKITKEGNNYFYEGSQGKTPATKKDDNTLVVPMGPIEVTVKLDPASGMLSVAFMGENYQYKRAK